MNVSFTLICYVSAKVHPLELRQLQKTYNSFVTKVQTLLVSTAPPDPPPTRALSPILFNIHRPGSHGRSNTNPQASTQAENRRKLSSGFNLIHSKYRISRECAELLIVLGGGLPAPSGTASPLVRFWSTPRTSRDRAITLGGDEPRPHIILPPPASRVDSSSISRVYICFYDCCHIYCSISILMILKDVCTGQSGTFGESSV